MIYLFLFNFFDHYIQLFSSELFQILKLLVITAESDDSPDIKRNAQHQYKRAHPVESELGDLLKIKYKTRKNKQPPNDAAEHLDINIGPRLFFPFVVIKLF